MIVHGLYADVPLRDYHLSFTIRAIDLAIKYYEAKKMKNVVTYYRKLREIYSKALSLLIKETKKLNIHIKHTAFAEYPIIYKKPEILIYLDPEYNSKV